MFVSTPSPSTGSFGRSWIRSSGGRAVRRAFSARWPALPGVSAAAWPTSAARHARWIAALVVAAYATVATGLLVNSLDWPLIHDAPVMHYIAWRISQGAVPYRDLFDMNFPGTYLVHLAALR